MIYNKEIDGIKFTFVCDSWNARNSWGLEVTLYKNDSFKVGFVKIRYYNRTWERYQFQSAIKSVIYNVIQQIKAVAKKAFLTLHNYKILTKNAPPNLLNTLQKI